MSDVFPFLALLLATSMTAVPAQLKEYQFDMGTASSPLEAGYHRVSADTVYNQTRGFGWDRAAQADFDVEKEVPPELRATHPNHVSPVGDSVLCDGVEDDSEIRFAVDVPPGKYWCCVIVGGYKSPRHDLSVSINGSLVAENIDAWGGIWGSQGGTPSKSVATISEPVDGQLRFTFDYVRPNTDRWKEYTTQAPEGGKLWYLGENRNSVLAIRIRPHVEPPIRIENGKIIGDLSCPPLQDAVDAFNNGRLEQSIALTRDFRPEDLDSLAAKGWLLDTITGSMAVEDRTLEIDLMEESIAVWESVLEKIESISSDGEPGVGARSPRISSLPALSTQARSRLESAYRYRQALVYINMYNYDWAKKKTGLNCYHRYWAAYDLCGPFVPDDSLYFKSHLVRGRVAYWNGREGGWKHCFDLARGHFDTLRSEFPDHPLVRIYSGEKVPSKPQYDKTNAPRAPEWASLQREAVLRYMDVIRYWVENRQAENGELGGGWGDDVEILRTWAPAVLAVNDPIARQGLTKIAEGVWDSGEVADGYSREVGDVEHAAEPISDTQPLMCAVDYGNPIYIERCMATMKCMRDVWTGINEFGHRHFRSHFYSASQVDDAEPRAADVALNGRAAKPGLWVAWYNRHPAVCDLIGEWCQAWIEDALRTDNGKPKGFVPGSVRFSDDRLGGYGENWWETLGYFSNFETVGYTSTLYHNMFGMYALTGDEGYMSALHETADAVIEERVNPTENLVRGSRAWAARVCDHPGLVDVLEKWRLHTGDRTYDGYLGTAGSPYMRYLIAGQVQPLLDSLNEVIEALSTNLELSTSEVLFTDRVSLPGSGILFEMMTGGVGNPTYYPLHGVTWENTENQIAALVEKNEKHLLALQVYSFFAEDRETFIRPWRLEPGRYTLKVDEITEDQRAPDFVDQEINLLEQGQRLSVVLPANCLVRIELAQVEAAPKPSDPLPDLALGPDAIRVLEPPLKTGQPNRLRISVHNIGSASTEDFSIGLYDGGRQVASLGFGGIQAPLDLEPKISFMDTEWIPLKSGTAVLEVRADNADSIREICEANNSFSVNLEVE